MSILFIVYLLRPAYEPAFSTVKASMLSSGTLQACNIVHRSVVSRNCSALVRITGPYSKTILLHCQNFKQDVREINGVATGNQRLNFM